MQVDGRWLTEEESYRARGFVKYDGEWMTPAEVQLAQSDAAREQARDEADKRASTRTSRPTWTGCRSRRTRSVPGMKRTG